MINMRLLDEIEGKPKQGGNINMALLESLEAGDTPAVQRSSRSLGLAAQQASSFASQDFSVFSEPTPAKESDSLESLTVRPKGIDPNFLLPEAFGDTEIKASPTKPPTGTGFTQNIKQEFGDTRRLIEKIPIAGGFAGAINQVEIIGAFQRVNEGFDYTKPVAPPMTIAPFQPPLPATFSSSEEDVKLVSDYFEYITQDRTFWGKVAQGISIMPTWMIEFGLTGGLAKLGETAGRKAVEKVLKGYTKTKAGQVALRAAGWTGGAITRTTLGLGPRVAEKAAERQAQSEIGIREPEGWARSFMMGYGDQLIEAASEEAGEAITSGLGKVVSLAPGGKKLIDGMRKAWMKIVGGSSDDFARQIATKAGYSNIIGEIGEEKLGALLRAAAGVEDFGASEDANPLERIEAALRNSVFDLETLGVEATVLSIPTLGQAALSRFGPSDQARADEARRRFTQVVEAKRGQQQTELIENIQKKAAEYAQQNPDRDTTKDQAVLERIAQEEREKLRTPPITEALQPAKEVPDVAPVPELGAEGITLPPKPSEAIVEPVKAKAKTFSEQVEDLKKLQKEGKITEKELGKRIIAIKTEKPSQAKPEKSEGISGLVKDFESGKIQTIEDLVDEVDTFAAEATGNVDTLEKAVEVFKQEQKEDLELAGRGDLDAAEDQFIKTIREFTAPTVDKTTQKAPKVDIVAKVPGTDIEFDKVESGFNGIDTLVLFSKEGKTVHSFKVKDAGVAAKQVKDFETILAPTEGEVEKATFPVSAPTAKEAKEPFELTKGEFRDKLDEELKGLSDYGKFEGEIAPIGSLALEGDKIHELKMIPTNSIVTTPGNARRDDDIKTFKQYIEEGSPIPPLWAEEKAGIIILEDGHQRLAAAKELGIKQVPVWIDKGITRQNVIQRAISEGKPVPSKVLAEFPAIAQPPTAKEPAAKPVKVEPRADEQTTTAQTPKIQTKVTETVQTDFTKTTSAKQESIAKDRESMGLSVVNSKDRRSWHEALQQAEKQKIPAKANRIAEEVNENPRPLSDVETAGVTIRMTELKNEHKEAMDSLSKSKDDADIQTLSAEVNRIEAEFDELTRAVKLSGTEKGRALAAQKLTINQDFDLVSVLNRAKSAAGKKIKATSRKLFKQLTSKLDTTNKRVEALEIELDILKARQAVGRGNKRFKTMSLQQKDRNLSSLVEKTKTLLEQGCNN